MIFRRRRPPAAQPPVKEREAPPPSEQAVPAGVVPLSLQSVAAVAWRVLVVAAAIYVLVRLLHLVWVPFLALAAALFLAALLQKYAEVLRERVKFRRGPAAITSVLTLLVVLAALAYFVETRFAGSIDTLGDDLQRAGNDFVNWLHTGPLHLSGTQIDKYQDQLIENIKKQQGRITSIGVAGLSSGLELLTGGLIALFTCFFLLYDGARMWSWVRGLFPVYARPAVDIAGHAAWSALSGYVRGTVIVAAIDGICIGIGLVALSVPLAVPLAVLIFLGAFVPLVGAIATGIIAVLVALVSKGWIVAVIVMAILILVQQIEGHLLQPLVLGRSVRLHPVAIIFSVAIGTTLAGIGGAVLSVPIVAVINASVGALYRAKRGNGPEPETEPIPPPDGEPTGI